jgi:hypothetical protein
MPRTSLSLVTKFSNTRFHGVICRACVTLNHTVGSRGLRQCKPNVRSMSSIYVVHVSLQNVEVKELTSGNRADAGDRSKLSRKAVEVIDGKSNIWVQQTHREFKKFGQFEM